MANLEIRVKSLDVNSRDQRRRCGLLYIRALHTVICQLLSNLLFQKWPEMVWYLLIFLFTFRLWPAIVRRHSVKAASICVKMRRIAVAVNILQTSSSTTRMCNRDRTSRVGYKLLRTHQQCTQDFSWSSVHIIKCDFARLSLSHPRSIASRVPEDTYLSNPCALCGFVIVSRLKYMRGVGQAVRFCKQKRIKNRTQSYGALSLKIS